MCLIMLSRHIVQHLYHPYLDLRRRVYNDDYYDENYTRDPLVSTEVNLYMFIFDYAFEN